MKIDESNIKTKVISFPYYIKRSCEDVESYDNSKCFEKIFSLDDTIATMVKEITSKKNKLLNDMFTEVSQLSEDTYRQGIKQRRKVLRDSDNILVTDMEEFFSESIVDDYKEYRLLSKKIDELISMQMNEYLKMQREEIVYLKSLKNNKKFMSGICDSLNYENFQTMENFFNNESFDLKKSYRMARTLKNYRNRMKYKPSPFSTFVKSQIIKDTHQTVSLDKTVDFPPSIYLNEQVIFAVYLCLLNNFKLIDKNYIRINPTLCDNDTYYSILVTNQTLSPLSKYFFSERVIKLKKSSKLQEILSYINSGNVSLSDIIENFTQQIKTEFNDINEIISNIIYLSSIGVLVRNFNISQLDFNSLEKLKEIYKSGQYSSGIVEIFLEEVISMLCELKNNDYRWDKDAFLKKQLLDKVKIFLDEYMPTVDLDINFKNIILKNNISPEIESRKITCDSLRESIFYVEKIFRLFDDNIISKILLRNIFLKEFRNKEKVSLMEFYNKYQYVKRNNMQDIYLKDDRDLKLIKQLRIKFLKQIKKHKKIPVVNISKKFISELIAEFPIILLKKKNYSVYFQKEKDFIIINSIAPGNLRHFSRYIDSLNNSNQREFQRAAKYYFKKRSDNAEIVDIGTTLALNINKHKPLTESLIGYPGSFVTNMKHLSDIHIKYSEEFNNILVVDDSEKELEISPMGFQFHRTAPDLYSFLTLLSNSNGVELSIWDRYLMYFKSENSSHFPRIIVDNKIVIERETWKISSKTYLDKINGLETGLDKYIKTVKFFKEHEIGDTCFFYKGIEDIDGILKKDDLQTNIWLEKVLNSKFRKPQYCDLKSYFDYRNFLGILTEVKGRITLQEFLPNTEIAKEYLIDITEVE
ncbi:hypothetical protein [Streptococcus pseudoporcinus]|uniref:Lantibiotic dehydratase, C terminus n=1 Tax=Streptococcus pseudoporcinus TaxID=361101 RepID=A0A4U9XTC7_9STRE|nr:hypothetical protein [Streptococcus pseudoporcinus]VTS16973.1 Lantibiotic dehydratase, C terminus [Streptococcus pseudoporcinus]VUC68141.1 Lantibiotic dehydratase, C terminus [Streptococcus pseudoporcinus]VUC99019.1 Lantibiotic dehydratase, C terminus [Streptococcus pseudoporcinus]VUC99411.1 Lantibiotic dehydratase, C terminus [Streptococcus pseudoporcinus]